MDLLGICMSEVEGPCVCSLGRKDWHEVGDDSTGDSSGAGAAMKTSFPSSLDADAPLHSLSP